MSLRIIYITNNDVANMCNIRQYGSNVSIIRVNDCVFMQYIACVCVCLAGSSTDNMWRAFCHVCMCGVLNDIKWRPQRIIHVI